jgi:hypothetical protein
MVEFITCETRDKEFNKNLRHIGLPYNIEDDNEPFSSIEHVEQFLENASYSYFRPHGVAIKLKSFEVTSYPPIKMIQ